MLCWGHRWAVRPSSDRSHPCPTVSALHFSPTRGPPGCQATPRLWWVWEANRRRDGDSVWFGVLWQFWCGKSLILVHVWGAVFSPREDLEKTRSGGCCGVQRGFHRFFRSRGLDSTWHWTRVTCALIGANVLWVGGWNLVAYDCAFTPTSGPCVQIPDGNASGLVYMPQPGTLRSHFNRLPHDPGVGSSNPFADTLPSWLGGSNTIAFRGEVSATAWSLAPSRELTSRGRTLRR